MDGIGKEFDRDKDIEYEQVLTDWKITQDCVGYFIEGVLSGRRWETSYIDHILFFDDSITIVTRNFHFYTLYYKDSRFKKFSLYYPRD